MPKLRQTATEIANAKIMEAIKGSAAFYCIPPEEQAGIAGVSRATWYRRLQYPGDFTVSEMRRMAKRYRWEDRAILAMMKV